MNSSVFNCLFTGGGDFLGGVIRLPEDGRQFGVGIPNRAAGKLLLQSSINNSGLTQITLGNVQ